MRRAGLLIPALIVLLFILGYVLTPLGSLLQSSLMVDGRFSLDHYAALLDPTDPANVEALVNSIGVSILSVLFAGAFGLFLAFTLTQFDFPLRRVLSAIAILPVALPPLVGVIAFLLVFGESGILPRLASLLTNVPASVWSLDGLSAIVAIHTYSFYVYFYLLVSSALRQFDGAMLESAAVLGSGSWKTFRKIVLPQLRPALAAGAILTFMASMASFSAPLLFAGARRFLTLQIYTLKLNGDVDRAAAQSVVLTAVSLIFFIVLAIRTLRTGGRRGMKGTQREARLSVPRMVRRIMVGLGATSIAIGTLPLLVILLVSFAEEGSWTWQIFPTSYTLENYALLLRDPAAFSPLLNSALMTMLAAAGTVVIGVSGALLVERLTGRRRQIIAESILTLPYAIPGTVVALALILAFNAPTVWTGYQTLVGTFWILPLAYAVRTYPLVHRATSAALAQVDPSLSEAGELLGAGPWRRWRKIVVPLVMPGVIAGTLLVVITTLGEFVSSILLYTYSSRPVSVEILAQLRNFNFGAAAAYCVLLLLVIVAILGTSRKLGNRADIPVR